MALVNEDYKPLPYPSSVTINVYHFFQTQWNEDELFHITETKILKTVYLIFYWSDCTSLILGLSDVHFSGTCR